MPSYIDEWLKQNPDVDRGLLEKILQLNEPEGSRLSQHFRQKRDVHRAVNRWLENATESGIVFLRI